MAKVFVSIGSNVEREQHIRAAIRALRDAFGHLDISSVYESSAVGFVGDDFYNLVVGFDTAMDYQRVSALLDEIERAHGRRRGEARFAPRTLDLDMLTYDDLVLHDEQFDLPRADISRYAFVLWPLAEIAPEGIEPESGKRYAELWQRFAQRDGIRPVPFVFD